MSENDEHIIAEALKAVKEIEEGDDITADEKNQTDLDLDMDIPDSDDVEQPEASTSAYSNVVLPPCSVVMPKIEILDELENILVDEDGCPIKYIKPPLMKPAKVVQKVEHRKYKKNCCIRGCQSVYRIGEQFFHFPEENPDIFNQWVQAISPEQNKGWKPSDTTWVCEYHFRDDCFLVGEDNLDSRGRVRKIRRLKSDAVPSIFGNLVGGALDDEEQEKLDKIRYGVKSRTPRKGASRQSCCMQGCQSVYKGPGLFFFRFPTDKSTLSKWMNVMNKQPAGWMPSREDWICMHHFKDDCLLLPDENVDQKQRARIRPRLKPDALPTIFYTSNDEYVDEEDQIKLFKIRMGDVPIKYACSAPKCGASTKNMIQLFSFPSHKDPNRLKWCRKFRTLRNDRKWTPGFCDRVCMAHFANECFALGTEYYDKEGNQRFRLRLKPNSIPSIFGKEAMTRVIVIPEDDDVDPERVAQMSTHDHNYLPASEIEQETPAFKKRKIDDTNADDMSWMQGAKSRLTGYGVEPDFIPELDLSEKDDKLTVFLKQKIVHQTKVIQELKQENRRARIVLNMVFNEQQMKKLGFDPEDPKDV